MASINYDDAVSRVAAALMDERGEAASATKAINDARRLLWPLLSVEDASAMVMR